MMDAARKNPVIREIDIRNQSQLRKLLRRSKNDDDIVPLFIKSPDGQLHIVPAFLQSAGEVKEGCKLVYLGRIFDEDQEDEKVVVLPRNSR
jgi:hypothetical protein